MTRAGNWPGGLRWIARRVKPSRRQVRNLTDYEKKTGWRYSITCTNIPGSGIGGVPGSHHPQYIDVVHREHACVETAGVRTAKAMGLRLTHLLAAPQRPARTHLTSTNHPLNAKGGTARRNRSRCAPGHPGAATRPAPPDKQTPHPKTGTSTSVTRPQNP